MENFIRVYDNSVSKQFCNSLIEYFEWSIENNRTWERTETTATYKKDTSTSISPINYWDISFARDHLGGFIEEFNQSFWDNCYKSYAAEFDTLNQVSKHTIHHYKLQKTLPGGGYHTWHCEHDSYDRGSRLATYILYLNDIVSGGETEFLYQHERVEPKEGRLVIFPSSYTHTHRGNPPLRGKKYILTGWIEFC